MVCLFLTWSLPQQVPDECIFNSACLVLTRSDRAFLVAAPRENVCLAWHSVLADKISIGNENNMLQVAKQDAQAENVTGLRFSAFAILSQHT